MLDEMWQVRWQAKEVIWLKVMDGMQQRVLLAVVRKRGDGGN